jgi:hypothetical protein
LLIFVVVFAGSFDGHAVAAGKSPLSSTAAVVMRNNIAKPRKTVGSSTRTAECVNAGATRETKIPPIRQ